MNTAPVPLWPGVAPGSETWTQQESEISQEGFAILRNVVTPTITAYLPSPESATGAGVVIAPGGGFRILAIEHEGTNVAEWFAARGIAAFVLKYRVLDTGEEDPWVAMAKFFMEPSERSPLERMLDGIGPLAVADAHRGLEIVRERHAEWLVDPSRLGFLGFSAGGYLTVEMALAADAARRPAFVAPIYPGLHGQHDVPADAPPLFTAVAEDDFGCVPGTQGIVAEWEAAGRPAEIHTFATGGHGFGLRNDGGATEDWIDRCYDWLYKLEVL